MAAQFGIKAVAYATIPIIALGVVSSTIAVRREVPFTLFDLAMSMRNSLGVAALTVLPVLLWVLPTGGVSQIGPGTLVGLILAAVAGWFVGIRVFRHPMQSEVGRAGHALRRRLARRSAGS